MGPISKKYLYKNNLTFFFLQIKVNLQTNSNGNDMRHKLACYSCYRLPQSLATLEQRFSS